MQPTWITLLSVLGGAIIAGAVGFLTQWYAAKRAREQAKENHAHETRVAEQNRDHERLVAELAREAQTRREHRAERLAASQAFLQALSRAVDQVGALPVSMSERTTPEAVTECEEASVAVVLLGPPELAFQAEVLVAEVRKAARLGTTLPSVLKLRSQYVEAFRRFLDA